MSSLGSFFGAFGRRGDASEGAPAAADGAAPDVCQAPTADDAAAEPVPGTDSHVSDPRPAAGGLAEAHRDVDSLKARLAEVEGQLRSTLERLGRRTTEVRNLEARIKVMDPLVEQVRQRDLWLDEARKETRRAEADRDAQSERVRAMETDLAALRKEVDWRDYVIRDLERMPDQLRERENLLVRLRKDHAQALADRDAELTRLRARLDELQRVAAA